MLMGSNLLVGVKIALGSSTRRLSSSAGRLSSSAGRLVLQRLGISKCIRKCTVFCSCHGSARIISIVEKLYAKILQRFGISKCIGVRRDVYQEKELGQLVQRRCAERIISRVNTLKFRGALKVLTPELIL